MRLVKICIKLKTNEILNRSNKQVGQKRYNGSLVLIIATGIIMMLTMSIFTRVIMATKDIGLWDYLISGMGYLFLVASLYSSQLGLNAREAGKSPKRHYRIQFVLSILAIIFFITSVVLGMGKPDLAKPIIF
jgi:hypothetical protein